ncbi:MAG TPA: oxidoreductase [Chloroflexota bacterium]|jgi:NAD(P)-dependent dehydrogenase (short-subunit alcohol dehydrogenase family)|nr:oxidoreductase [Chloroflexota bacterium]
MHLPPPIAERRRGDRVDGKVAIVTGAGEGIGRAGAELLGREGARVVVANRTPAKGEATVEAIRSAGGEAVFVRTDVSREADCVRLVGETVRRFGRLDVLVNNAAIYPRASLAETTVQFWREIMATNLEGPFLLCREAVPAMLRGGGGSIVNVGSFNGLGGGANLVAYSVSKGGLLTLTRNIAAAYARQGIRCNYLIPGWNITETEKVVQAREGHDAAWLAEAERRQPGGRFSVPADAAYAVLWLASDESVFVNGAMINTDGGAAMLPNARRDPRPDPARSPTDTTRS